MPEDSIFRHCNRAVTIGLGTSFPKLTVNVTSAVAGHTELAISNTFGSNIFFILGVTALIRRIPMSAETEISALVNLGAAVLLLVFALFRGVRMGRVKALTFSSVYVGYIVYAIKG